MLCFRRTTVVNILGKSNNGVKGEIRLSCSEFGNVVDISVITSEGILKLKHFG